MDFPGRLIAGLMAAILIILFPLQYIAHSHNEDIDVLVDDRTHQFTDNIRQKGYLDKQMYEEYVSYLDTTGEIYDIEIQDIHPVTGEDVSHTHKTGSFKNVSYNKIMSFATHNHTDDCYPGNLHICNGTDCEYENEPVYLAIPDGRKSIYYSKNGGVKWEKVLSGSWIINIAYGNGKYVASDNNIYVYTSEDGYNWEKHYPKINGKGSQIQDITFYNGYFYTYTREYIGNTNYSNFYLAKSVDGVNWVEIKKIVNETSYYFPYGIGFSTEEGKVYLYTFMNKYYRVWEMRANDTLIEQKMEQNFDQLSPKQIGNYIAVEDIRNKSNNRFFILYGNNKRNSYVGEYVDIAYSNNKYMKFDMSKNLYIGNSATAMTKVNNHNMNIKINANTAIYGIDDKFVICGETSNGYAINISPDGVNWIERGTPERFVYMACNADNTTGHIDKGECIKKGKYFDDKGNEVFPICDRVVKSITATHPVQTVDKGGSIITTATATYLDGHTGIVNCTSNFNPNLVGNQTVTLTYTGLVGNAKTTGTRTCTVNVTVKSHKSLTSITVLPPAQTIQKYSNPSFTVRAYYNDGTNKILNSAEYTISGFNPAKMGTQNVTISYTEEGITKSATVTVIVTPLMRECPRCHNTYELNPDDSDPGCPYCKEIITGIEVTPDYVEVTQGESLPIIVTAIYNDGSKETVTGWTSNYNPEQKGLQVVTVEYGGYGKDITVWVNERLITCPVCNTKYPESEGCCPVCSQKVIRITADPEEVTVNQFEDIPLTVTAYFANGESRVVDDWSIDRSTQTPGTYTATVSYQGVSTTIKLTVISIYSIQCPICGTIYDISENPRGCPVCSDILVGIEAYLKSGSNIVQLGTTPTIAVILIFRDEHREFAYDGFTLEGFNPNQLGVQTATVRYKEFSTTIILEVVNAVDTITCPNGHIYYRNADGTDPGCPFCNVVEEVSKIIYFDITYTNDILNEVYTKGAYNFDKGNYITVIVVKKDKSLLYKAQKTFPGTSLLGRKKRFIYGGNIQKL